MSASQGHPDAFHRNSEARSLPPDDAKSLTYLRIQADYTSPANTGTMANNAATPASTQARQSIDGASSSGGSPSQLFGGVEQLIREGQDWWLRDQNQLAVGFDNWNYNADDIASWFANQATAGSPGQGEYVVAGSVLENGINGGAVTNVSGNGNVNGTNGVQGYEGGMTGYNESEWYQ